MDARRGATMGCFVGLLALGTGACGSDDGGGGGDTASGGGKTLTIYSDMPLQGAGGPQSRSVVNGKKLALEQNKGMAGKFKIKFVSLDNSTAQAGSWTPEATSANARKVAGDSDTAVYIGEFNSGAAAVSIPILNEADVPMISPANTAVGLTTKDPGRRRASRTSTTRRASAITCGSWPGIRSRARRWSR